MPSESITTHNGSFAASQPWLTVGTTPPEFDATLLGARLQSFAFASIVFGFMVSLQARLSLRDGEGDDATPEVVADHLQRFAERVWRRPVKKEELVDYLHSYRAERETGEKSTDAYRIALQGVLTSRNFIYLVEGDPEARQRLTDSELASRLSYFLWASTPDDALLRAAGTADLSDTAKRNKEIARMLADPRSETLATNFGMQWLRLTGIEDVHPEGTLFPEFTRDLARPNKFTYVSHIF